MTYSSVPEVVMEKMVEKAEMENQAHQVFRERMPHNIETQRYVLSTACKSCNQLLLC